MKKLLSVPLALFGLGLCLFGSSAQASALECDYTQTYSDPHTLYVARDGSGDYQCDGVDDQVEINAAFAAVQNSVGAYTSVFLKSGTYVIGEKVNMVSNSVLAGDRDAVLKLKDQADWTVNVPLIGSAETAPSNLEIKCFEADMNYAGNYSADAYSCMAGAKTCTKDNYACCENFSTSRTTGKGYYNVAGFSGGSNYSLHDMYLHDGLGDGLNVQRGFNTKFYDNRVDKMGHEGLYVKYSDTAEAFGNTITNRTNSGLRADDTNHVSFHDNDIQAFDHWSAGGPGIEIVKDNRSPNVMNDIQIFNNVIHGTYGPGIWITASGTYGPADTAARIHHNVFYTTGINPSINWTAGILTSGFYNLEVENNVFDRVYNGALIVSNAVNTLPAATGYVTTFKSNIVVGTQPQRNTTTNGYGIINSLAATHTVNSQNNVYYQNYAGDYSGAVSSIGDLQADPLWADALSHDYHLKSSAGRWDGAAWVQDAVTSPAIDAGHPASAFAFEPLPNGGRIDAGFYGNTAQASKSPLPSFILTVSGGSGSGPYLAGQDVTISAAPAPAGQVFDRWTGDVAHVADPAAATTTVTMPGQAIALTATYKDVPYNLTVAYGTGGGFFLYQQTVTIAANAAPAGQVFDRWTGDTGYVSDIFAPTTSVTMPASDVSLAASYKETAYALAVVKGTGSGSYDAGEPVTIAANAAPAGQVFDRWTGDVSSVADVTSATATFTMPAHDLTLTATYKTAYYLTVNSGSGDGYFVSASRPTITAAAPAAGKVFSKWTGDVSYVSSIYVATATVTMPSKNISLTASYKSAPTHYLTVNSGAGDGYYYLGKAVTIKANTPATGKVFDQWTGDVSYVSSVYAPIATVTMPNVKISLTATYKSR